MKKKIEKKLLKLKIYLIEIIFFIAVLFIAWISAEIQHMGRTLIKEEYIFLFPDYLYRYDLISYFIGMAAFFAVFLFLYKRLMSRNNAQIVGYHLVFKMIYWVIDVFFAIIMFIGLCVLTFGDFYEPECLAVITNIGWPVFTALFVGINVIRKARADKFFSDAE